MTVKTRVLLVGSQDSFCNGCRFVPMAMVQSAIGGFVLLIVAAMGTWAVYGEIQASLLVHDTCSMCCTSDVTRKHE